MLLKTVYDRKLAQASYLIADERAGIALVIDPARDIRPYLEIARIEGVRIEQVTETHIHADFVSGARELADHTGARLYLSAMGGPDWQYAFADDNTTLLRDGDSWMVGAIRVEALHRPGHTPEHLIFQITDTANADRPMGIFTGDVLFVGDVGRPDLLETAAKQIGTKELGARQQFANVQWFKSMPDYLQIWPGHGAGSACGKALGSVPSTTLGYEKLFNPAFQIDDETAFVEWLLTGQPETPRYFARMKQVNKEGPALLRDLEPPVQLEGFILAEALRADALVIDARPQSEFVAGHVPGVIGIPGDSKFNVYVGEFVDYARPTYLIAEPDEVDDLIVQLRAIGVDNLPGYFPPRELGRQTVALETVEPADLAARLDEVFLLDVRDRREYEEGHIPAARHLPLGSVADHLDDLPRDRPIVVQCGSGVRSQAAASLLLKHGFTDVANLRGGIDAWKEAKLPVESGEPVTNRG